MKYDTIMSQLDNVSTVLMLRRQMVSLAASVFHIGNLSNYVSPSAVENMLVYRSRLAIFKDEVLGTLILPFETTGNLDVYDEPIDIIAKGANRYSKYLKRGEYVILYDNMGRYPLILDINQYANRMALDVRVSDVNIQQQKTPRLWKVTPEQELSFKQALNNIDSCSEAVVTWKEALDLGQINSTLQPAPYIADKLSEHNRQLWNDFLRLIGIDNYSFEKAERNITAEVEASQGGTIASRYNRYYPRYKAIEEWNEMSGDNLYVSYYDGLPDSKYGERGVDNVVSADNSLASDTASSDE